MQNCPCKYPISCDTRTWPHTLLFLLCKIKRKSTPMQETAQLFSYGPIKLATHSFERQDFKVKYKYKEYVAQCITVQHLYCGVAVLRIVSDICSVCIWFACSSWELDSTLELPSSILKFHFNFITIRQCEVNRNSATVSVVVLSLNLNICHHYVVWTRNPVHQRKCEKYWVTKCTVYGVVMHSLVHSRSHLFPTQEAS